MGVLEDDAGLSSKWTLAILIAATVRASVYEPCPDKTKASVAQTRHSLPRVCCLGVTAEPHEYMIYIQVSLQVERQ